MKKKIFEIARILFLGAGLFLLIGIIRKTGWENLVSQIAKLGFNALPIFAAGFLWHIFYVLAWRTILKQQGNLLPFWSLFRVKVIGETINTITPANFLGGDPMRVYFLRTKANPTDLAASVAIDRTINSVAIVAVLAIGAIAAFISMPGLTPAMTAGIVFFLLFCSGLILFFFSKQKRGLFTFLASKIAKKHIAKAQELDQKLLAFYQTSHKTFWTAFAFHVAGRILGIAEVYLIGCAMEPQFTLFIALILATLAPIINMLFTFIPSAVGVLEGAYSATLFLLGLPPSLGLAIQIVKRIRQVLWISLGLGFALKQNLKPSENASGLGNKNLRDLLTHPSPK